MIYKEIEDTDKVAGRVRTVAQGMFSNNEFEMLSFYYDKDQISNSNISGWWNSGENSTEQPPHKPTDVEEFGSNIPIPSQYEEIDLEGTKYGNEKDWTLVTNGDYYVNVYDNPPVVAGRRTEDSEIQFSIAYGLSLIHI